MQCFFEVFIISKKITTHFRSHSCKNSLKKSSKFKKPSQMKRKTGQAVRSEGWPAVESNTHITTWVKLTLQWQIINSTPHTHIHRHTETSPNLHQTHPLKQKASMRNRMSKRGKGRSKQLFSYGGLSISDLLPDDIKLLDWAFGCRHRLCSDPASHPRQRRSLNVVVSELPLFWSSKRTFIWKIN